MNFFFVYFGVLDWSIRLDQLCWSFSGKLDLPQAHKNFVKAIRLIYSLYTNTWMYCEALSHKPKSYQEAELNFKHRPLSSNMTKMCFLWASRTRKKKKTLKESHKHTRTFCYVSKGQRHKSVSCLFMHTSAFVCVCKAAHYITLYIRLSGTAGVCLS